MSQYRSILKATSIFGGTQILQMMVTIIRSKFVAILIGSTGMGLSSMYMSSLTMIITIFGLGLGSSVVRDLSRCYGENDMYQFSVIVSVYKRILTFLSIAGALFVIAISSLLSEWAFKTKDYTTDYCWLSLIVFFTLLSSGNSALLVSMRRIKDTAASGIIGSIVSLITSIPLFYFYGIDGIVPGLIVSTFANYIITWLYARRITLEKCEITRQDIHKHGFSLISLGVTMIIASLIGQFTTYLINISISRFGGLSDIGFFNAAMGITMQVLSMVFAAMAADYYPRLVASMSDEDKMSETINEQSEILLYIAVPILAMFMVIAPIVIQFLLSEEFLVITTFIRIVCMGMLLKTASYALGYASFAKGDKKIYFFLEGGYSNITNLLLSVSFYYLWGLTGLAYSFVVNYILYYVIISYVDCKRYHYKISRDVKLITLVSFASIGILLLLNYLVSGIVYYSIASVLAIMLTVVFLYKLNTKTELLSVLKAKYFTHER